MSACSVFLPSDGSVADKCRTCGFFKSEHALPVQHYFTSIRGSDLCVDCGDPREGRQHISPIREAVDGVARRCTEHERCMIYYLDGKPTHFVVNMSAASRDSAVDHPAHYTSHPSGIEAIDICEHMNFCRGNAIKYLWRAGSKGDELTDLRKARWYIDREIARLEKKT